MKVSFKEFIAQKLLNEHIEPTVVYDLTKTILVFRDHLKTDPFDDMIIPDPSLVSSRDLQVYLFV